MRYLLALKGTRAVLLRLATGLTRGAELSRVVVDAMSACQQSSDQWTDALEYYEHSCLSDVKVEKAALRNTTNMPLLQIDDHYAFAEFRRDLELWKEADDV